MADGVTVRVRLTPKASRDAVTGRITLPDGTVAIKAAVTAVPESGRANDALIRLLATSWRVPRSAVTIAAGVTDRNKILHVAGEPDGLLSDLAAWLARIP